MPIDKDAFMNSQQQYGSASTFSKRYAFCNAFGILTGDEDNDTRDISSEQPEETPEVPTGGNGNRRGSYETGLATFAQTSFIQKLLKRKWHTKEEICMRFHVRDLNELTVPQASSIIDALKKLPETEQEERGDDGYRAAA